MHNYRINRIWRNIYTEFIYYIFNLELYIIYITTFLVKIGCLYVDQVIIFLLRYATNVCLSTGNSS